MQTHNADLGCKH